MKVLPEIGEISVSNDLWDGKNESKILRQFLIKVRKRLGISVSIYLFPLPSHACPSLPFPLVLLLPLVVWNCYSLECKDRKGTGIVRLHLLLALFPFLLI